MIKDIGYTIAIVLITCVSVGQSYVIHKHTEIINKHNQDIEKLVESNNQLVKEVFKDKPKTTTVIK